MSPYSSKIRLGPKKKVAFVCSGGGTKAGAFHLGVALALKERGFRFFGGVKGSGPDRRPGPRDISVLVGSSAGAIISSYLASGYTVESVMEMFQDQGDLPKLSYQKIFRFNSAIAREQMQQVRFVKAIFDAVRKRSWESLIEFRWVKFTGLCTTAGIEQFMREEVLPTNSFHNLLADLYIIGTQLNHSRKVVFGRHHEVRQDFDAPAYMTNVTISDACAASTALPLVFTPHLIEPRVGEKHYFIDGEIRETLSTHVAADAGADLIFASYTHQPYHFKKEIGSLTTLGLPAIIIQSIYLLVEQKINHRIQTERAAIEAIESVTRFCKNNGISQEKQKRITEILETKLRVKTGVDKIFIHPRPRDTNMFFIEHFSLNPKKLTEIVACGYKAASEALSGYEFS